MEIVDEGIKMVVVNKLERSYEQAIIRWENKENGIFNG